MLKVLQLVFVLCMVAGAAQAAVLAQFTFNGVTNDGPYVANVADGLTVGGFTATGYTDPGYTAGCSDSTSIFCGGLGRLPGTNATPASPDLTKYLGFSVTNNTSVNAILTSLDVVAQHAQAGASRDGTLLIRSSADSFATNLAAMLLPTNSTADGSLSILLSTVLAPGGSIEFRFYPTDNDGASVTARLALENVTLNGVVPEPSTYLLMGAGLAALAAFRRRTRRS